MQGTALQEASAVLTSNFKAGMRRLSSSVCLITVGGAEGRNGMTATAVCAVSADPPVLLIGVNRSASIHGQLTRSGVFGVNILRPTQRALADRFSSGESGEARFANGQWISGALDLPLLADSLASFACKVIRTVEIATHEIFFGHVVSVNVSEGGSLLYGGGEYEISLPVAPQAYLPMI